MDAFHLHKNVTDNYDSYLRSFFPPMDARMKEEVDKAMNSGRFIPEPLLQFNPAFRSSKALQALVDGGLITANTKRAFGDISLFDHQVEAISLGTQGIHPEKQGYKLASVSGTTFSGFHLLAYYYVSFKLVLPELLPELHLPYDAEYAMAEQLYTATP